VDLVKLIWSRLQLGVGGCARWGKYPLNKTINSSANLVILVTYMSKDIIAKPSYFITYDLFGLIFARFLVCACGSVYIFLCVRHGSAIKFWGIMEGYLGLLCVFVCM